MSNRLSVIIQALIMLVVGAVMVWFYTQGRIGIYLTSKGTFQVQALLAGVVLGVVALFLIITAGKEDGCCHHDHDHDHGDGGHDHAGGDDHAGHGHDEQEHDHHVGDGHHHHEETLGGLLVTGLVILVPLVSAAIFTPDAYSKSWVQKNSTDLERGPVGNAPAGFDLGSNTSPNRDTPPEAGGDPAAAAGWGPYTLEDFQAQVDRNEAGEYIMDVISIFFTGGDKEVEDVVSGLPVETMGQVIEETVRNPQGHRIRVFRLMMNCCVADARPVSIPVDFGGEVPPHKEMGWYRIHGTMSYEKWDDYSIPVLRAERMELTEAPEQAAFGRK